MVQAPRYTNDNQIESALETYPSLLHAEQSKQNAAKPAS